MRNKFTFLTLLFILSGYLTVFSQTQFWSDTFEDIGAPSTGTRTLSVAEFSCGGSPATAYFMRTAPDGIALQNGTYSGFQGSKFFAGEDIDKGPSCTNGSLTDAQQVTWSDINISGKTGLSFKGLFAANPGGSFQGSDWGTAQDKMEVEYRIDGGSWTKIIAFYATTAGGGTGGLFLDTNGDLLGDGTGLTYAFGEFSASITGTGTTLDLRVNCFANATSVQEIAFDNLRLYASPAVLVPSVTTSTISVYTSSSATLGGNVTADGGATVTERGVVYSTTDATPTIAEGATKVIIGSGTGSFSQSVGSLTPGTLYYVNAYASNSAGTSYGIATSFTTSCATPPDQDFGSYSNTAYGASLDYQCITYSGSDCSVAIGNISSEAITASPAFSGSAAIIAGNSAGGYGEFYSTNGYNFKLVSLAAEFMGHSSANSVEIYNVVGYRDDTEVVRADNLSVIATDTTGSGNAEIIWTREDFDTDGSNSGVLSFGTGWQNIDKIRFEVAEGPDYYLYIGLDNINFEEAISASIPTITTTSVSTFNATSATMGGEVTADGGANVTERGVVYSTTDATPTIAEGATKVIIGSGTGSFSQSVGSLTPGTLYYVNAYATNSAGTGYGEQVSFTTNIGELIWDGSESDDWHTAANWDLDLVPTSGYNVTIPTGLTNYPTLSSTGVCNNLTIESSGSSTGSLSNQNNLTVNGTTTIERYLTGNAWHMVSSPAPGQTISGFLSANANVPTKNVSGTDYRGMMDYNEPVNNWNTFFLNVGQSGNLTAGKGFSLRTDADGIVAFTGTLATGSVNTTVARTDNYGWNCVGNPYPSAIFINDAADADNNFIDLNTANLDESYSVIYVWEQGNDAYSIVSLGDDAFYAQSGQAFFVKVKTDATQVQFTTAMQTHQPNAAFKSGALPWPELKLTANLNGSERTTRLKFNDEMSTGLDVGYDAGVFKTGFDIYTQLVENNGVDFGLQSLPLTNIKSLEIPVGLDLKEGGELVFSIQKKNFPEGVVPVLKDKLTGGQFVLTEESDIYTTSISGATKGYGRFTLAFSGTTGIDKSAATNLKAWYKDGYIYISGQMEGLGEATVYDVNGRKVAIHQLQYSNLNQVEAPAGANGIYLVKIKDSKRSEVLKVPVTGR